MKVFYFVLTLILANYIYFVTWDKKIGKMIFSAKQFLINLVLKNLKFSVRQFVGFFPRDFYSRKLVLCQKLSHLS